MTNEKTRLGSRSGSAPERAPAEEQQDLKSEHKLVWKKPVLKILPMEENNEGPKTSNGPETAFNGPAS